MIAQHAMNKDGWNEVKKGDKGWSLALVICHAMLDF